jgi:hypothetical protein
MAKTPCPHAISHQNVRLGPGRHPRPGKIVCVMELASMLAGERFGDRPASVCPVIGALLRAYNDNVEQRRRQDLYRFAADAVDTRRDHAVQHRRAQAALGWARKRYEARSRSKKKLPVAPDAYSGRDEIAFYVLGSLERRGHRRGRWTDESHEAVIALLEWLISMGRETTLEPLVTGPLVAQPERDPVLEEFIVDELSDPLLEEAAFELLISEPGVVESALEPLVGRLLEHVAEPVEYGGGGPQLLVAERVECLTELCLGTGAAVLDELATAVGEGGQDDAPVALGPDPIDQPRGGQSFEHLGDARRAEIRRVREIAERQLALVAKAEQQAVLRVGELARAVGLAPAHPSQGGKRSLERSRDLLGGVALLALAYHVSKRR